MLASNRGKGSAVGRGRKDPDESLYSGRIASRLRKLREETGKSVDEMATAISMQAVAAGLEPVTAKRLYAYECGDRTVPPDLYPAIASAFGKSVRGFLPAE